MSEFKTKHHSKRTNNWIVQKYGGTSIGKFAGSVATIVRRHAGSYRVAVVCSARSSGLKSEGTTNQSVANSITEVSAKLTALLDSYKPLQTLERVTLMPANTLSILFARIMYRRQKQESPLRRYTRTLYSVSRKPFNIY